MDTWLSTYINVLETLSPDDVSRLKGCTSEQIEFKDPFNHTTTQYDFIAIMEDMYLRLDNVCFEVRHSVDKEHQAFIEWTFSAESKLTGSFSFDGTSRLIADKAGRIIQHYDYWDSSELMEKIPFIGNLIRFLKAKMSHKK